nr:MAG TPA: hypothetical protein [Caudoviricetes sp.]
MIKVCSISDKVKNGRLSKARIFLWPKCLM